MPTDGHLIEGHDFSLSPGKVHEKMCFAQDHEQCAAGPAGVISSMGDPKIDQKSQNRSPISSISGGFYMLCPLKGATFLGAEEIRLIFSYVFVFVRNGHGTR